MGSLFIQLVRGYYGRNSFVNASLRPATCKRSSGFKSTDRRSSIFIQPCARACVRVRVRVHACVFFFVFCGGWAMFCKLLLIFCSFPPPSLGFGYVCGVNTAVQNDGTSELN